MPFGQYFNDYYISAIKPAIAESHLSPVRADEVYGAGAIIEDIYNEIKGSTVLVADVTGKNPNVSYELGMAHALNKPVVIITQSTEDVPFDYKHLRHIRYDVREIGWVESLKKSIKSTIEAVLQEPSKHLALKSGGANLSKTMIDHLVQMYFQAAMELSKSDEFVVDENGSCTMTQQWTIKAHSDISHICHNIVLDDAPGAIEILGARDRLNAAKLDTVTISESERHLSYLVLMRNLKPTGSTFVIELEVKAENYFFDLITKGSQLASHHGIAKSKVVYKDKVETYVFPNIPKFSSIKAEYLSHPDPNMVGKTVCGQTNGDQILLKLDYSCGHQFTQEHGVRLYV